MYSYADRLRAVELYMRFGKRLNATIRQLGYPTKNAFRAGTARTYSIIEPQPRKIQTHAGAKLGCSSSQHVSSQLAV
jgi:hypothetical protein